MIVGKTAVGVETKEIEWLWKPFIAFGKVTMIQGDTGVGKTSLMVKIVADCTNGLKPPTQFHGRLQAQEKGEPLTTFYVTTENGIEDTLIPMFDLYGGDREHLYYQDEDEGHFVLNGEEIRAVVRQIGAKLIVIDPRQEFLDDISSTSNEKVRAEGGGGNRRGGCAVREFFQGPGRIGPEQGTGRGGTDEHAAEPADGAGRSV